jgi:hypothetical protein
LRPGDEGQCFAPPALLDRLFRLRDEGAQFIFVYHGREE